MGHVELNEPWKGCLFTICDLKQGRGHLVSLLLETRVFYYFNFSPTLYLPMFTHDPRNIDLGLQITFDK